MPPSVFANLVGVALYGVLEALILHFLIDPFRTFELGDIGGVVVVIVVVFVVLYSGGVVVVVVVVVVYISVV